MNKSGEIRLRRGANRSEVRPRTAEQGPRVRGCAPDPVREAPVREGAHKAAIGIGETGRNASAPANGPAANGSQPPPVAGCLRNGKNAGLYTPTRSHPQRGPCSALRCAHLGRICNEVWGQFSPSFVPLIVKHYTRFIWFSAICGGCVRLPGGVCEHATEPLQ